MSAHASGARTESAFDAARRAVSIEDLLGRAGVKLVKAGAEKRGPCPICGAGSKSKSFPLAVKPDRQTFRTYCGCDLRGDVVDLEQALGGGTLIDAARRLVGGEFRSAPRPAPASKPANDGPSASDRIAAELWDGAYEADKGKAQSIWCTLAERYLHGRGIAPEIVNLAARNLRFHPRAKWGWDDERREWITAPAMLAQVVTPAGPTGGVHATYLANSPPRKADLAPAKRMWGRQTDADGRQGGAWLIGPHGPGKLVVAEGIETALSVATLALRAGDHVRVCAALSLNRLQGGVVRDEEGTMDVFAPQPNPEAPAFTWPTPPAQAWTKDLAQGWPAADTPWPEVLIAVDRDMSAIRIKGRTGRGKVCWFEFGPEERARLCSRLAAAAWLAAGAPRARAIAPPPGMDFNDELRRVLALECGA